MIETRLKCSFAYARSLRNDLSESEFTAVWERILTTGERFNRIYLKEVPAVLEKIPQYSGFHWGQFSPECINVYLADFPGPSHTNPVTIKIATNLEKMLLVLTHELVHVNMPSSAVAVEGFLYEDIINQVTTEVIKGIGLSCPFDEILSFRKKLQREGCEVIDIPLTKLSVRDFFECKIINII